MTAQFWNGLNVWICASALGTFKIVEVALGGSLFFETWLDDEFIDRFSHGRSAIDSLVNGEKPWPSKGNPATAKLPREITGWVRRQKPPA